jgi:ADP-ribose pyrophosphatase YjhB (NUDIX family)
MKETTLFPLVLVDIALFSIVEDSLRVLLVKRAHEPEVRRWALPGGIVKPGGDASLEEAANRVMRSKVSVDIPHLEQVRTFSGPDRDPRGWSVSVLFWALLPYDQITALVRDKVETLGWVDASNPGHQMAFDHREQLTAALHVLRSRLGVSSPALPLHLMPKSFTLTALQKTCQSILGREIDKAAFRRRLKGSPDLVELTGEMQRGSHAPAQLYRARDGFTFNA